MAGFTTAADRALRVISTLGAAIAAGSFLWSTTTFTVEAGHRAVLFDNLRGGIQDKVVSEGLHFRVPLVQEPRFFEVRRRPFQIQAQTASKDLQNVNITLRLLFRPDEEKLPQILRQQDDAHARYDQKILPGLGSEILTSVVAQYDAEELITQRESVSRMIRDGLTRKARQYHIILDDVSITHASFSEEYARAIELKQIAQQDAERSRFLVDKAKQEKLASITLAEGESEAARLLEAALSGPGFVELRRIQAAVEIAETLSRSRNVVYLPNSGNMMLAMPVDQAVVSGGPAGTGTSGSGKS